MYRFYVDHLQFATEVLDENMIPYDFDSGNRIMIEENDVEEAMEAWDEAGVDYDEV